MTNLIGEYSCRLDAKGRVMLPVALKKQISPEAKERFVINRGFENCLVLYPVDVWKKISQEVNELNLYNKKNRDFVRSFYRGATELSLDNTNRLLIPKNLMDFAGINHEIMLSAFGNRIEIWSKEKYAELLNISPEEFATLAEEVMGGKKGIETKGDVS